MAHTQEKKQSIEIPEKAWMLDLLYKDFQLAIMNTFEELRKSCKELKGRKRIMSHQIEKSIKRTGYGMINWFKIEKGVRQHCILPVYLTYMQSTSCETLGWMKHKVESELPAEISLTSDMQMTSPFSFSSERGELKGLLLKVKEETEKAGLKLNIQKSKIMASGPITSWQIDGETTETVTDFIFLDSKITVDGDCNHEIKRRLLLGGKAMTNLTR